MGIVKIIEDIKGGLEVGESDNLSEWLETISDKCHPKILCALGLMYSEQLDHEKALLWFSKAANRQDSNGQFHLAETYQRLYWKERDKKNLKAAVEWYDKAAQQQHKQAQIEQCRLLAHEGDRDSQFYLGQIYQLGLGVEQSDREAFKWYTAAAEGGHADAQFSLGELYFYGQGVQQNRVKASQWFRMVFGKRQADARYYLRKIGESSL